MAAIRLNKFLSICGITSRRGAEALVAAGRVALNGTRVEKLGVIIDDAVDQVTVDGEPARPTETLVYILLNKPRRTMTTLDDPFKRRTVRHLLKDVAERVYPVGRLDYDTEGALLLTNDGALAYRLTHPRYGIKKVYEAVVEGQFTPHHARKIQQGIPLEDGVVGRADVTIVGAATNGTRIRLMLTEGRKREVRQLCKSVDTPVRFLKRIDFAGLTTRGLPIGSWRYLTNQEIADLRRKAGLEGAQVESRRE